MTTFKLNDSDCAKARERFDPLLAAKERKVSTRSDRDVACPALRFMLFDYYF